MKAKSTILLMLAVLLLFAGEALATPAWVKTTWSSKLVKNPNAKNAGLDSADYWAVEISVKHANNSGDRDITAFYDKTGTFSAVLSNDIFYAKQSGKAVKYRFTSNRVNKKEVWPGQAYSLVYWIPVKNLISAGGSYRDNLGGTSYGSWYQVNDQLKRHGINAFQKKKLSYNVNIRSKKAE